MCHRKKEMWLVAAENQHGKLDACFCILVKYCSCYQEIIVKNAGQSDFTNFKLVFLGEICWTCNKMEPATGVCLA